MDNPKDLCAELARYTFNFTTEADLQQGIKVALEELAPGAWRSEYCLSSADRIDFFHPETGTGIEVKIKGGRNALLRQLLGYAQHDEITSLIVVTSSTRLGAVPDTLNQKSVHVVQLIAGLL